MINPQFYAQLGTALSKNGRPEDVLAKSHANAAAKLKKMKEDAQIKLGEIMGKMSAIEEQMAGLSTPQPTQPMSQNENLISGGIGALALALGARPQYVQGGLDAYRGVKQDQSSRKDQQNLAQYQQQLNTMKAQLSGLGRQGDVIQSGLADTGNEYAYERNLAQRWGEANVQRANDVYDQNQRQQNALEVAKSKTPFQTFAELLASGVDQQTALEAAFGKQFEGAGRGEYLKGKNEADAMNTNTRAKTALEVAQINADARIKSAGIAAQSGERRAIISGEYGMLRQGMINDAKPDQDLKDIRKEISAIDQDIREASGKAAGWTAQLSNLSKDDERYAVVSGNLAKEKQNLEMLRKAKAEWVMRSKVLRSGSVSGPIGAQPKGSVKPARPLNIAPIDPARARGLLDG